MTWMCFKMSLELKETYYHHPGGGGEGEGVATIYAPQVELLCALRAYYFSRPFFLMWV